MNSVLACPASFDSFLSLCCPGLPRTLFLLSHNAQGGIFLYSSKKKIIIFVNEIKREIVKAIITKQELCTLKAILCCVIVFNRDHFPFNMDRHCSHDCLVDKTFLFKFTFFIILIGSTLYSILNLFFSLIGNPCTVLIQFLEITYSELKYNFLTNLTKRSSFQQILKHDAMLPMLDTCPSSWTEL